MSKPKIKITLIDRIGKCSCHRGHKIGSTPPTSNNGEIRFCCPDVDMIHVFKLDIEKT